MIIAKKFNLLQIAADMMNERSKEWMQRKKIFVKNMRILNKERKNTKYTLQNK